MIKVGIMGYGNLGRGVEFAVAQNNDMTLAAVFTRRDPGSLKLSTPEVPVYSIEKAIDMKDSIDVMILCGGSATDLPELTPRFAAHFNLVDSFDTHANIPQHEKAVGEAAEAGGKLALISAGWDPGLFSIMRCYFSAALPNGSDYTFWGRGVSQGHSDAVRRIPGVKDARQYTVPVTDVLDRVRKGENPELSAREKHTRECFVVAEEGADRAAIERAIVTMPNYFSDYDTTVHFIDEEEMKKNHSGLPHGGFVIRSGKTGPNGERSHAMEFSLKLESNPEFTASVLVAYARAVYRMNKRGQTGCRTVLDIAPADISRFDRAELIAHML